MAQANKIVVQYKKQGYPYPMQRPTSEVIANYHSKDWHKLHLLMINESLRFNMQLLLDACTAQFNDGNSKNRILKQYITEYLAPTVQGIQISKLNVYLSKFLNDEQLDQIKQQLENISKNLNEIESLLKDEKDIIDSTNRLFKATMDILHYEERELLKRLEHEIENNKLLSKKEHNTLIGKLLVAIQEECSLSLATPAMIYCMRSWMPQDEDLNYLSIQMPADIKDTIENKWIIQWKKTYMIPVAKLTGKLINE